MRVASIFFKSEIKLHEFAQACLRLSPQIMVLEPSIIGLEIEKCRGLYSEAGFKARVQVLLRRFNYTAHIAIADDLPMALSLARYGVESIEDLPLEALCDFGDPLFKDSEGRKSIGKMIEAVTRLGIHTVRQFKNLPTTQFPSRFGSLGLFCRQQIEARSPLPWPQWTPPETYLERLELVYSEHCASLEPLLFKAKELLDRLFSRLRGKFLRADQIRFTLELEKYSTVKKPIRQWTFEFIAPQGSTSGFLPILKERLNWDLQKEPIESYVIAMEAEVVSSSLGRDSQRNLFHSREDFEEKMGAFFGQLEEYLGRGQVFWASVTEERFPERSWIKKRLPEISQVDLENKYPQRPTRIFKNPIPITLIQDRLYLKKKSFAIDRWSSVERLSLNWIEQVPSRNYYCVDLKKGTTLWVFSDPSQRFYLHGYYE